MTSPALAPVRPEHADAVDALILRSKAFWGYDAEIMNVMARVLRLDREAMKAGRTLAGWIGDRPIGICQISEPYETARGRAMELQLLFIGPEAIGTGLGRTLYAWAIDQARAASCVRLDILSDPNATGFYAAMGARFVEDRASKTIPGRTLPWYEHDLR
ncbi:MAG: GNAT family N-acetyltransferase [Oceanicaulis sp.]